MQTYHIMNTLMKTKKKLLNERVWYKVVNVYDGIDEGSAFVPVLTKEKKDYLENLDDNEFSIFSEGAARAIYLK